MVFVRNVRIIFILTFTISSRSWLEFLDGMSIGTARFIIDREISSELLEKYIIKDLENRASVILL